MIIKDAEGRNLGAGGPPANEGEIPLGGLASVPFAFDHDGDGDLDLIVGNIAGSVILIPNVGTAKAYSFDVSKRRNLEADGKPLKVNADAGPVAADWDGDGFADLVVGSGNGTVLWYRNVGKRGAPEYAAGRELVSKATGGYSMPKPYGEMPKAPGHRTKVCVTDWNGDGLPDLLVGDLWYEGPRKVELSAGDVKRRDELKARDKEIVKRYRERIERIGRDAAERDEEIRKMREELKALMKELEPLDPQLTPRGAVWLYLRTK